MAWLEIRTSLTHSVVQSTNHWATEDAGTAYRLFGGSTLALIFRKSWFITLK